ncbi:MAG: hypothetical protein AB1508_16530 [Pseudomonadota bacterium]
MKTIVISRLGPSWPLLKKRCVSSALLAFVVCTSFWTSAAMAQVSVWTPQQKIPGIGSSSGPSLAAYGGKLFMAWKGAGNDDGIYLSSSADGKGWASQQKIPGIGSSSGPSLAALGSTLFMAWKGAGDDEGIYLSSSINGRVWPGQRKIPNIGSAAGPALTGLGDKLFMAWRGAGKDQGIYWSSSRDGRSWAAQQKIPGIGSSMGPCLTVFGGKLFMAWKGAGDDQGLYWSSSADGQSWSGQQKIPGVGSSVGPSCAALGEQLVMAWKGDQDGIYLSKFNWAAWTPQQKIPDVGTASRPSLAAFENPLFAAWRGAGDDQGIYVSSSDPLIYIYHGWHIDLTRARGRQTDEEMIKAVDKQLNLVEGVNLRPQIVDFMRTIKLWANPALDPHWGAAHYNRATGVDFRVRELDPQKPILLHELLHAYHDQKLGRGNQDILNFWGEAKSCVKRVDQGTEPCWPSGSYMLTDAFEFFATTASVYLDGDIERPPHSKEELCKNLQSYCVWLNANLR